MATAQDSAGWPTFLRSLIARGLSGVQLVISDARIGLVNAIGAALPGASWQQADTDAIQAAQIRHALDALEAKFPTTTAHLDVAQGDVPVGAVLAEQNNESSIHHSSGRDQERW